MTVNATAACGHLGKFRGKWIVGGVEYPHHLCQVLGDCTPREGHPSLPSCVGCVHRTERLPRVDVVITSHNYGRFVAEALESVYAQSAAVLGKVIVVDDASDPDDATREICERAPEGSVEYLRVELRCPHLARGTGFGRVTAPLVLFLDADNVLPESFLAEASRYFLRNESLAIVYPDLQRFGDSEELLQVPEWNPAQLERMNFIDTGAVTRTEAIRQVEPFRESPDGHEDWWFARQILRSGKWTAQRHSVPLRYRMHGSNRHKSWNRDYFTRANMQGETVTIFTTFSERIQRHPELWERRKEWLREQTWPRVRLVVANTSHAAMPAGWDDGLPPLEGLSVYTHDVGIAGLEDRNRAADQGQTEAHVQTVVAAIYNRMWRETQTEFVLILEDDVFPEPLDTIEHLLDAFDQQTAGVTGAYQQRYHPYGWTAWRAAADQQRPKLFAKRGRGIEAITGCGFGCLMLRRSQVSDLVIQGNTDRSRYYDTDLWHRLAERGAGCKIHWGVVCDHAGERFPPPPPPSTACVHRGEILRTEKCQLCGSALGPKGTLVQIRACSLHGECAAGRYKAGQRARSCSTCDDWTA